MRETLRNSLMRRYLMAVCLLLGSSGRTPLLPAQTELITRNYFPADLEFVELKSVESQRELGEPASLAELPEGAVFAEAGFRHYARRTYRLNPPGFLTIETVTLNDGKAAYSLLSLLRNDVLSKGPPGDFAAGSDQNLIFSQANVLVRIKSEAPGDLARRVARSVGNRIAQHEREPSLIANLPKLGLDPVSLRYCLGPLSFARYAQPVAGKSIEFRDELEIAQARYSVENQTGILSLVGFPTIQLADEYFESVFGLMGSNSKAELYLKKSGPMLAILEGNFAPRTADRLLGSIEFSYSVKWIYDANRASDGMWSVSSGLMGTVVRSLAFTGLLAGLSLVAGGLFAMFRILLRGYAPNNFLDRPDRTELIRLKFDR
jgi:Family of unknown function (DUF6599)